jgi:hypothetical protein
VDDGFQPAFLLGMRYKPYLSQNEHSLVLKCALPLEVCEDSSFQHGQVSDARAKPYWFLAIKQVSSSTWLSLKSTKYSLPSNTPLNAIESSLLLKTVTPISVNR